MSQDIVYTVTCGRQKTPKHVLLPYGIKTLTGNVELIQMINRLGHGVSYHQLEENDTALCLQRLASALNERVILPQNIQPYVFTNLSWDNIDRLETTGAGTSHRVNGIAVQPREALPAIAKRKKRNISVETQELPQEKRQDHILSRHPLTTCLSMK